jgi:hypothetical protein
MVGKRTIEQHCETGLKQSNNFSKAYFEKRQRLEISSKADLFTGDEGQIISIMFEMKMKETRQPRKKEMDGPLNWTKTIHRRNAEYCSCFSLRTRK